MQKMTYFSLAIIATVVLSGCSLLGNDDSIPENSVPAVPLQDSMESSDSSTNSDSMMQNEIPSEYPAAVTDPTAEQKGMMEAQSDAPTGVSTP